MPEPRGLASYKALAEDMEMSKEITVRGQLSTPPPPPAVRKLFRCPDCRGTSLVHSNASSALCPDQHCGNTGVIPEIQAGPDDSPMLNAAVLMDLRGILGLSPGENLTEAVRALRAKAETERLRTLDFEAEARLRGFAPEEIIRERSVNCTHDLSAYVHKDELAQAVRRADDLKERLNAEMSRAASMSDYAGKMTAERDELLKKLGGLTHFYEKAAERKERRR